MTDKPLDPITPDITEDPTAAPDLICGLCGLDGGHEPGCPSLKLELHDQRLINTSVAGQLDVVRASEKAMAAKILNMQQNGNQFPSPFDGQPSHMTPDGKMITPLNQDDPRVRGLGPPNIPQGAVGGPPPFPGQGMPQATPGHKQVGWICPSCGTGVSPFVPICLNCNKRGEGKLTTGLKSEAPEPDDV